MMSRKEVLTLKLQMGIDPSAHIDPKILLNMWQQLQLESEQQQSNHSSLTTHINRMTCTPMVV